MNPNEFSLEPDDLLTTTCEHCNRQLDDGERGIFSDGSWFCEECAEELDISADLE